MAKKFTYKDYKPSSEVTSAKDKVTQLETQKPGDFQYTDYKSQYAGMSENLMNQYLNRDKFTYDINGDALYQQYKDQYINQGQMAMMDTMGQAAALTGGYGNSYAQSVGQQTYQGYLQQLNDKIPELYKLALDQYNREGDELLNKYGMVTDADDRAYGRWSEGYDRAYGQHRDSVADWNAQLARADENYWNTQNFDYGKYSDNRTLAFDDHWNGLNYDQTETWNQKDYDLALQQFEHSKNMDEEQLALAKEELALQKKNSVKSSSGGSGGNNSGIISKPPSPTGEGHTPLSVPAFTGVSYAQAINHLNKYGLPTGGLIPVKEFKQAQMGGAEFGGKPLKNMTYAEYLREYCEWAAN